MVYAQSTTKLTTRQSRRRNRLSTVVASFRKGKFRSIPESSLKKLAARAHKVLASRSLRVIDMHTRYLIECSFVDNQTIRRINKKFRSQNKATDVISLSYFDNVVRHSHTTDPDECFVGEIFISVPYARTQAAELGHSLLRELEFLFVHGLLHVFGFDHIRPVERKEMFRLTDLILGD
ncbi:MAG: rRNA maturation RNase YbeY [Patescibacteria group bacterium]